MGATVAASRAAIPIAHVEAGLRSHDRAAPWPEEDYRVLIDERAALLFAPTERAAANLAAEGAGGAVYVTGNSGIDAVLEVERNLQPAMLAEGGIPRILVTCHRRESWGEGLESIACAVRELARSGAAAIEFILHPNPHVAAKMRALLGGTPVNLLPPCGHRELVEHMRSATLILSDSGGIQEEAPALGVPLLVLREKTERPEGVDSGNSILVGTDSERILAESSRLLADPNALARMSRRAFPFGDGRAGERIAALIEKWLERRALSPICRRLPRSLPNW
jgi:UDP-N-acetylglucosamine 2-epimerase (non-hydrolysing)